MATRCNGRPRSSPPPRSRADSEIDRLYDELGSSQNDDRERRVLDNIAEAYALGSQEVVLVMEFSRAGRELAKSCPKLFAKNGCVFVMYRFPCAASTFVGTALERGVVEGGTHSPIERLPNYRALRRCAGSG